jgi:hypothetical protein
VGKLSVAFVTFCKPLCLDSKTGVGQHSGPPGRSPAKKQVANLPQEVELGTGWFAFLFSHPCRVAGPNRQTNTLFGFSVGWL